MTDRARLADIAYARSGDKGSHANIGVWARDSRLYPALERAITAERVQQHFAQMGCGEVQRFELPNLHALNFVLVDFLDGGGTSNLTVDAQGKTLGIALLEMTIDLPEMGNT